MQFGYDHGRGLGRARGKGACGAAAVTAWLLALSGCASRGDFDSSTSRAWDGLSQESSLAALVLLPAFLAAEGVERAAESD